MWELLKGVNWSEGFYKAAFFIVAVALAYAMWQGGKFFGKRFISILEGLQNSQKQLADLSGKMDTRIQMIEQEQKFQNDRLLKHDQQFDKLMDTLLKASKR